MHHGGERHAVAPVAAAELKDPTGCGDAYRAGLLLALLAAGLGGLAFLCRRRQR